MARERIDKAFADRALMMQAEDLAALMNDFGCRSAMVRVFVDDFGKTMASCNIYGPTTTGNVAPVIEFRREL